MRKNDRRTVRGQSDRQQQLKLPLRELVREALFDMVVVPGLEYVGEVLEEERIELCGARHRHDPERRASRAGSMPSSLTQGGRRVQVERPRMRSRESHELTLPSWRAWSARDPMEQRALEQMALGVSTRRYARSLEARPLELEVRGVGKSAVSERFVGRHHEEAGGTDAARSEPT
jgi:putative transposase